MSKHVKNQHYVPRFLLKKFSSREDNFIWAYDKNNDYNKIKERPIRKVANEFFFYDQIKNSKKGSFEYVLQTVENDVAPIIEKILKVKNLRNLNDIERDKIALFVASQIFRTKGHLFESERMDREFSRTMEEHLSNPIPELNSKELWFSTLANIPFFKNILLNKIWHLIESNNEFYISDNPVVRQNSTDKSKFRGTLGIDSYGIEIYLPLSPSIVIALFCEKFFNERGYNNIYIDKFQTEPDNIKNLNWLQTKNSDRFIFSSKKDFSLVQSILQK